MPARVSKPKAPAKAPTAAKSSTKGGAARKKAPAKAPARKAGGARRKSGTPSLGASYGPASSGKAAKRARGRGNSEAGKYGASSGLR